MNRRETREQGRRIGMDVRYVNPFIKAAGAVFETMIHLPVTLNKVTCRRASMSMDKTHAYSATIRLAGACEGLVAIRFSTPVAVSLISAMMETPVTRVDPDGLDALGEITSMIVGNAKKDLPCGLVNISTPRVTDDGMVDFPNGVPVLVIPAQIDSGPFRIEASIKIASAAGAATTTANAA